jgi:hypothetical protein
MRSHMTESHLDVGPLGHMIAAQLHVSICHPDEVPRADRVHPHGLFDDLESQAQQESTHGLLGLVYPGKSSLHTVMTFGEVSR